MPKPRPKVRPARSRFQSTFFPPFLSPSWPGESASNAANEAKNLSARHPAGQKRGVLHAVDDFFVRRAEGGQRAAEYGLALDDKIIRTEPQAAVLFCSGVRAVRVIQPVAGAARFFVLLQNVKIGRREGDGTLHALLPFLARAIAAENDTARPPGGFVKAADLEDEIALLLRGRAKIPPVVERPAARMRAVEHGTGRKRRRVHHPGARDERAQQFERTAAQMLSPEIGQQMVMKKREGELLLLKMPHRRRNRDLTILPGLEEKFCGANIGEVEELEEAVKNVDFFRIAIDVEEERAPERENRLRPEAKNAFPLPLQFLGQPLHFRPVGRRLVADDKGDERITL